jgi:hypothetical protein
MLRDFKRVAARAQEIVDASVGSPRRSFVVKRALLKEL